MSNARSEPDPLLSDLGPVLAQAVLCGGVGLPPAWGPLGGGEFGPLWAWDPTRGVAVICGPNELVSGWAPVLSEPLTYWRLPLDYWRPRLAIVAAWMLWPTRRATAAGVCDRRADPVRAWPLVELTIQTTIRSTHCGGRMVAWSSVDGRTGSHEIADLSTLPAHLASHDPSVAVPLALLDVPEIRARITPGDQETASSGPADADPRGS